MPYLHCRKCHHEWEGYKKSLEQEKCDWCGANKPKVLEAVTPFEKFIKDLLENPEKWMSMLKDKK